MRGVSLCGTAIGLQEHQVTGYVRPTKAQGSLRVGRFPLNYGVLNVPGYATVRCIPWPLPETYNCLFLLSSELYGQFYYQAIDDEETTEMLNCQPNCEQGNDDLIETCFFIYQE